MITKYFLLILAVVTLVKNTCLANDDKKVDSLQTELLLKVPQWMAQYHVPCVGVGLISDGKIKWVKVFGELRQGVTAPENTLFNIASQTKPVVAMLTLKLEQHGNWNLDEPLAKYWIDPDIANDPNLQKLTTRHVLSHQTGFSNWRSDNGINKLRFNAEPGTKFGYSGEGFEYLRKSMENKFGQSLDKMLDSVLFKPLGMNNSGYWRNDLDTSRFAKWHDGQGKPYAVSTQTSVNAADDMITTVADYCKLGIFTMNGAGLSPALFADMISPVAKVKEHYYRSLGWGLIQDLPNGSYAVEHGGSDVGVRTMAVFLPQSKQGIVVMTNGDNGMYVYDRVIKMALPDGEKILETMYKGPSVHERTALADSIIQQYAGDYQQENGKLMHVATEGGALKVSGDGLPTAVLFPESPTKFFLPDYDVQLEFPDDHSLIVFEGGKQVMKIRKVDSSPKTVHAQVH